MRILVFGDSITYGAGGIGGSWVEKTRAVYDSQPEEDVAIINLGISGDTSQNVIDRFSNETLARNRAENLAFLFAIGTNDSKLRGGEKVISRDGYRGNIEKLIRLAEEKGRCLAFVELIPCMAERISSASIFSNERIMEFNTVLHEVCAKNNIRVISLFDEFAEFMKDNDCLPDGLHPNDVGYEFMASKIQPKLHEVIAQ